MKATIKLAGKFPVPRELLERIAGTCRNNYWLEYNTPQKITSTSVSVTLAEGISKKIVQNEINAFFEDMNIPFKATVK